nr:MAG TPA: hypothetical protein [Caudoviricetes sp.]
MMGGDGLISSSFNSSNAVLASPFKVFIQPVKKSTTCGEASMTCITCVSPHNVPYKAL